MWVAYALGCPAGLMVIGQLVPFAQSVGIAAAALTTMTLVVGACGNASGRILSGWMSGKLGRINVLRTRWAAMWRCSTRRYSWFTGATGPSLP